MLLTIGIITFNRMKLLTQLIESIKQSETPPGKVEILILNNGSTDGTDAYLKELKTGNYEFSTIYNETNQRGGPAYKKLIQAASGSWIICPGDDDLFKPNSLTKILEKCEIYEADKRITLLPFGAQTIDKNNNKLPKKYRPFDSTNRIEIFSKLFFESIYWMPSTVFRKESIQNTKIPNSLTTLDWWIWLNGICQGTSAPDETEIINYRVHDGQEQHSYPSELWNLDRLSIFNQLMESSKFLDFIKSFSSEETQELISNFDGIVRTRSLNSQEKFLLIQLMLKLKSIHFNLTEEISQLLISSQIDPRLVSVFFEKSITKDLYITAIKQLSRQVKNERKREFETSNLDHLEEMYNSLALELRSEENINQITPFENKLIKFSRRIRQIRIVKKIFNR